MGSEKQKNTTSRIRSFSYLRKHYVNQFSVASLASRFSAHSFGSNTTFRSTNSASRPWSRVSRRIWKDSTLENSYQCVKTAWPVSIIESLFLPEFRIDLKKKLEFEVINIISRGAFGKVYRVMNNVSQEYFAMKVLSKSKVLRDNYVSQVKDEVKIQSMCGHHPFIISSPQYWQNRRKLFIVSQCIEGGDLFDLSEKYGPLPEELVQIYVAQLGSALDFLHNAGVIYRDLKAENILLDADGHIVLIDFGLSKWLKYGQRTSTLCGTLQYMAPEIFTLNGYGHAIDWWALGTLTVYLLTTKFVSSGNSRTPGELPSDCALLSAAALDLVKRLLTVDPTRRLRSLLTLQRLSFLLRFDLSKVKMKKVKPRLILEKHFPNGPKNGVKMIESDVMFFDFDKMSPIIV